MSVKVYVVFYSTYGHIYRMAEAVAQGAKAADGVEVSLFQVPEIMDEKTLKESGAFEAKKAFAHIPIIEPDQMADADALIFGTPTRFGNMAAQMRNFWDRTGGLWVKGSLVGKPASVFASTATQHGGQETTLTSFHTTLLHHGMIIVGVPFIDKIMGVEKVNGGSPYGATTIAGPDGSRLPSEDELAVARFQGLRVAELALKLKA